MRLSWTGWERPPARRRARQLRDDGSSLHGESKFLAAQQQSKVYKYRRQCGDTITDELVKLGCEIQAFSPPAGWQQSHATSKVIQHVMSPRILVVDDEEPVSSMLKVVLEANGYAVTTASSAAQAVEVLAAESFAVVLTDMKMESDTAGYDVVRAAKALPNPPGVVILTAYPLLAQDWRAAGADAAMSKPTQMALLLEVVDDLAHKRHMPQSS